MLSARKQLQHNVNQTLYAIPLNLISNLHITPRKLATDFGFPSYWRFLETAATRKRRIKNKEIRAYSNYQPYLGGNQILAHLRRN